MTQPDLFSSPPERQKKRGAVRATSVLTAQAEAPMRLKRGDCVRLEIASYAIEYCHAPTSAELTKWHQVGRSAFDWTYDLLYVRRGLSDLQTANVVERVPNGDRTCRVTKRKCCTWRLRTR